MALSCSVPTAVRMLLRVELRVLLGKKAYVCVRDRMDSVCCDRPQICTICTLFQFSRKCIQIIIVIMYFQLMYNFEVYV